MSKLRRNLPRSFLSLQASKSSDKRIEASQFSMAIFEHKTSAPIGEGLTYVKCSCEVVISGSLVQSLQRVSLAAETTGGKILGPNMTLKIFLGEHTPRPHLAF